MSACTVCGNDTHGTVPYDEGMCSACYAVEHLEEHHGEGWHDDQLWDGCALCYPCPRSFGVHDCVLAADHAGAHECDDECDRGCTGEYDIDPRWLDSDDARDARDDR